MNINWEKKQILKIGNEVDCKDQISETDVSGLRERIEPWLTAVFQSEHLSLLAGAGLTVGVTSIADTNSQEMNRLKFNAFGENIKNQANEQAKKMKRGKANMEDDLRVAIELHKGLLIQDNEQAAVLKTEIDKKISDFTKSVLKVEHDFFENEDKNNALSYLKSFLVSFASRTSSRDRLQIFTTNYDRFIEYAMDKSAILSLDRFKGKINPIFRINKLELDYHYNPPGIRGEPRYVEGVVKYTKLHGSLNWQFNGDDIIRSSLSFGAKESHPDVPQDKNASELAVIYPNSAKGIETALYPYSELFRDFSTAVCRPNSVVVTYGYGFGDSHINRILKDMLTIPSTHIVIISWDTADGRITKFVNENNASQFTLLIGSHFGDLKTLVDNYLPKAAIDRITERMQLVLEKRGPNNSNSTEMIDNNESDDPSSPF